MFVPLERMMNRGWSCENLEQWRKKYNHNEEKFIDGEDIMSCILIAKDVEYVV